MDELFVIVDITDYEQWRPAPCRGNATRAPLMMPERHRSTVLQLSRRDAEEEARRLALQCPGRAFAVFQATHIATQVLEATHVNLKGEPRQFRPVARVLPFDGGIPF